jgi:tripartite-type tricarboxylate transporter receptor subunit TctC
VIVPNVGAIPFAKDARLRILGVTSLSPSPFLPGAPPVAKSVPGYEFDSWFGLLAPARTPKPLIERINAEVAKLLRDPAILARLSGQGVVPRPLSPEAFAKLVREDYEETAKMVKTVGKIE